MCQVPRLAGSAALATRRRRGGRQPGARGAQTTGNSWRATSVSRLRRPADRVVTRPQRVLCGDGGDADASSAATSSGSAACRRQRRPRVVLAATVSTPLRATEAQPWQLAARPCSEMERLRLTRQQLADWVEMSAASLVLAPQVRSEVRAGIVSSTRLVPGQAGQVATQAPVARRRPRAQAACHLPRARAGAEADHPSGQVRARLAAQPRPASLYPVVPAT